MIETKCVSRRRCGIERGGVRAPVELGDVPVDLLQLDLVVSWTLHFAWCSLTTVQQGTGSDPGTLCHSSADSVESSVRSAPRSTETDRLESRCCIACRRSRLPCRETSRGTWWRPDLRDAGRTATCLLCPCRWHRHWGRKSRRASSVKCPIRSCSMCHRACSISGRGSSWRVGRLLWAWRTSCGLRSASCHGRTRCEGQGR